MLSLEKLKWFWRVYGNTKHTLSNYENLQRYQTYITISNDVDAISFL